MTRMAFLAAAVAIVIGAASARLTRGAEGASPVTKVVSLLGDMKKEVEGEVEADKEIYDKMACWCETNDREKTEAIKYAEGHIDELNTAIDEGTAHATRLAGEIENLKDEIAKSQASLDKAASMRAEEKAAFEEEEKFSMDTLDALKDAIAVLSKVQLVQEQQGEHSQAVSASLAQVRSIVSRVAEKSALRKPGSAALYKSVMQKDLWDFVGALPTASRVVTGLEQESQPKGGVAGAKSYSSRSNRIFGVLEQMQETFSTDLAKAHKAEMEAEISFQRLRSTKEGEMQVAAASVEEKSTQLADTNEKVAVAKENLATTTEALESDRIFLADLKETCSVADKAYAERQKTRGDEILAISDTIAILMDDDARDTFSKASSPSFMQVLSASRGVGLLQERAQAQAGQEQRRRAASQLMALAHRHRGDSGGFRLAALAVGVKLDSFTKVKEMMTKMIAELKEQQAREVERHDTCNADISANERATREKQSERKDIEATQADLEATMAQLTEEIEELNTNVGNTHLMLKRAGEDRKAENHEFQQVVTDQRMLVKILTKALDRLRDFYGLQRGARGRQPPSAFLQQPVPGAEVAPAPASGKEYGVSKMSGGILQMIEKIIQSAKQADQEAVDDEKAAQQEYAKLVADTNAELAEMEESINQKTLAKTKAEADQIIAGKDHEAAKTALADLADISKTLHTSCDYLIKNFNIRQQGRQEEIEAVQEAEQILSGAGGA